jgi:hypothetical protein
VQLKSPDSDGSREMDLNRHHGTAWPGHSSGSFSYASSHNTFKFGGMTGTYSSPTTTGTTGRTQRRQSSLASHNTHSPVLTPPNSTRTSFENTFHSENTPTPPKPTLTGNTDLEETSGSPICPPLSPPASAPSSPTHKPVLLDDIISQVKDVLAGRTNVCELSHVTPELYEQLDARAKVDDGLAGWDGVRYVVLTRRDAIN